MARTFFDLEKILYPNQNNYPRTSPVGNCRIQQGLRTPWSGPKRKRQYFRFPIHPLLRYSPIFINCQLGLTSAPGRAQPWLPTGLPRTRKEQILRELISNYTFFEMMLLPKSLLPCSARSIWNLVRKKNYTRSETFSSVKLYLTRADRVFPQLRKFQRKFQGHETQIV